jgi:hypothetical protein
MIYFLDSMIAHLRGQAPAGRCELEDVELQLLDHAGRRRVYRRPKLPVLALPSLQVGHLFGLNVSAPNTAQVPRPAGQAREWSFSHASAGPCWRYT